MAKQLKLIKNKSNPIAFLDILIKNEDKGTLLFELYEDITPKTATNFKQICVGDQSKDGIQLRYQDSIFHRIIPGFMCQGGDFTQRNGTGGYSIYGRTFSDENFTLKHEMPGALSMANAGKNTNGSQFFVTLVSCPWLDGAHTVFGQLVVGFRTLKEMESQGTKSGIPKSEVKIGNCGVLAYEQLEEILNNLENKS